MGTITIRNLPDEIIQGLKQLARRHKHSMEQEARNIITQHVSDRYAIMKKIEESFESHKRSAEAEEVTEWLKESRRWSGKKR
jgi:predicted transcriptional regulator